MSKPLEGSQGGRPEKFAWLTEDQSLFNLEVFMAYVNLYQVQNLVDKTDRNLIPDKFLRVDWVVAYGDYLSSFKYNSMPWKKTEKTNGVNRGQTVVFAEIAAMYLEWLCGVNGWELKSRVIDLIYPKQTIYFIQLQEYQKIGISENFKSRLSTIQNATPFDVSVITTNEIHDARKYERVLHLKYYSQRVNGEWFKLNFVQIQDVKKYIDSIEQKKEIDTNSNLKDKNQLSQLSLFNPL